MIGRAVKMSTRGRRYIQESFQIGDQNVEDVVKFVEPAPWPLGLLAVAVS